MPPVTEGGDKDSLVPRSMGKERLKLADPQRDPGYGLQLFRTGSTPEGKKRQVFWFLYFAVVFLAQVWPLYMVANRVQPMVLSMPFSMFWVVLWIVINFAGLVILMGQEKDGDKK